MSKIAKLLPLCGFVIAVALVVLTSSFKAAHKTMSGDTLYQFAYNPPATNPYSVTNVENVANWSYSPSGSCTSGSVKACTILASQVDDSDPSNPVLLSSEDITASTTTPNNSIVSSTADAPNTSSPNITNRVN